MDRRRPEEAETDPLTAGLTGKMTQNFSGLGDLTGLARETPLTDATWREVCSLRRQVFDVRR